MKRNLLRSCAVALAAGSALLAALPAQAACFYVYGPKNDLLYRSTIAPVDLSRPISQSVRARFGGGHLTMVPDESDCPDLAAFGPNPQAPVVRAEGTSPIEASPLFRNIESRTAFGRDAYLTSPSRAARGR